MSGDHPQEQPPSLLTPELIELVAMSSVETAAKQERAIETWGIGTSDGWSADFATGTISFRFATEVVTGPVHLLGSYSRETGTWLWGWANEAAPEGVRSAVQVVRRRGEADDALRALAEPKLNVPETFGDDLAAVAVEVAGLAGYYRAPIAGGHAYLGFSDFSRVAVDPA